MWSRLEKYIPLALNGLEKREFSEKRFDLNVFSEDSLELGRLNLWDGKKICLLGNKLGKLAEE